MANIIKSKPDAGRIENIINNMKQRDKISHLWNLKDKEELREHAYEIVNHMNGPEMTKLVNDHIVHTTIDFNSRIKTVFKLLKLPGFFDKNEKYFINDYFIRIEHQMRGAPHAHILLWMVHTHQFEEKKTYVNGEERISQENRPAPNYRNSVLGKRGQEREEGKRILEEFADELITLDLDDDLVTKYQTHKHTFTCTKQRKNSYFTVQEDEGFGKEDGKRKGPSLRTPKCRFHFPRFPMRKTSLLEPLVQTQPNVINENSVSEIIIKKADVNLNRIRKFMLRNLFSNDSDERQKDREAFFNFTFDEFLDKLGISEVDYIRALRRSVKGRASLFLKRKCNQVFVNNYNKNIMAVHPANQDFAICIDEFQVAGYIVNYLTKNEAGQSKILREVDEQCAKEGLSYSDKLKRFAKALDQSREVSIQEIVYRLLGLPMTQFSRKIKYLSTCSSEKRDGILKPNLDDLDEEESVFLRSAVDYYEKRPDYFEKLTLADFWSRYEIVYSKSVQEEEKTDDNFDDDYENLNKNCKKHKLMDNFGTIRERQSPAILKYYIDKKDDYETIRGTLLLFHPFRNEQKEITSTDLRIKYQKIQDNPMKKEQLQSQIDYYQPYHELLEGIEDYIRQQEEEDEIPENSDDEGEEPDDKVEENDLKLETTKAKDIQEFLKDSEKEVTRDTGLMEKKALLERISMLNIQQRKIFDDIISRLISGDFEDNPFLIYISGDAGTGKSFLFNTIINAAKHILREAGDNFDQPRVLNLAPSGVAATIINGKTIESALPIMNRNRSGVIVQGAASKADLNFKYEKLQLILIDEISMVGSNKNQSIHEVLTSLGHLDRHKPYGGLSVILTGDLKQLDPVKDSFIFKQPRIHGRCRAAENLWGFFQNYHLTEKVRSAGDLFFSELSDRIGYNRLMEEDIKFINSRNIDCPLAKDPENFKKGKVAYIVAENKRRAEINQTLLNQFYEDQQVVKNDSFDQLANDVYLDPKLPYTQTAGLPTCLELKKFVPVMITVNSKVKRYKENGKNIIFTI